MTKNTKKTVESINAVETMEEENLTADSLKEGVFPVLALRDMILFPFVVVPLFVGRDKSIAALNAALDQNKPVLLLAQKDAAIEMPATTDLYQKGTLVNVLQLLKLPDGTVKVLVEGIARAQVEEWTSNPLYFEAHTRILSEKPVDFEKQETLKASVVSQFKSYVQLNTHLAPEALMAVTQLDDTEKIVGVIAMHLDIPLEMKQKILEKNSLSEQLEALFVEMEKSIEVLQMERKIRKRVKRQMDKSQREYYLNEQLKAIQKELGDEDEALDLREITNKIKKAGMSAEAQEKALNEVKKLKTMGPLSAEAGVIRGYVDWLLSIPWKTEKKLDIDLKKAKEILDNDHYGLEKVKERILEFLAVQKRTGSLKGSVLCLVGPPGVGKTSLGQSIARATGRTFVRASLGGLRDEAEIRGHRRTYIGAMPGKIIQGMKKAKTNNPLFLLDEIDKVGNDYRGDPAAALLEVLDPEQNTTFNDLYIEVDYDLSHVMFITTANTLKMSRPLLDRMEIIELSGYTEAEKVEIAKRHLIKKQLEATGLNSEEITFSDDALIKLIREYTRESGVRNLEREIANIFRKVVKEIQIEGVTHVEITPENLKKYAGVKKYSYGVAEKEDQIGITTGLAWTEVGGEILSIEAVTMPGKGKVTLTGQLGEVMKESVEAAHSYVRSHYKQFGIPEAIFNNNDIHVHVPEGATPKDGPSAGITMLTSLVSVMTGIPVRKDIAMTGEITLRGRVLPIGGLKEKLLAALRAGIKTVLIPAENEKDLEEIPENVKAGMEIIPVAVAEQVLSHALKKKLTPLPLTLEEPTLSVSSPAEES